MGILKTAILFIGSTAAGVVGFWISHTNSSPEKEIPRETETAEITEKEDPYSYPSFEFAQPFDARKELDYALSLENATERFGRLVAIGYHAARENPEANLQTLSPEIWTYPNYDLRGAFHSEWMRSNPDAFLPYAEKKYKELEQTHDQQLFPSYHLSYMEPFALLALLPQVTYQPLKEDLRINLLRTLIELDPALLWERKEEIASSREIIQETAFKGKFELALQFWEMSDWEDVNFYDDLFSYMAKTQRLNHAAHLRSNQKVQFATHYALEHPLAAAQWIRAQPPLEDIEYEFDQEHSTFFAKLFATEGFSNWPEAHAWLSEGLNADQEARNVASLFTAIRSAPDACKMLGVKDSFADYLSRVENSNSIKNLYLSIENDHPILEVLERFVLFSEHDFGDAIVARITREPPTPDRLMQVLEFGNLEVWPDEYVAAARETINALSDDELLWNLSPSMILATQEIAPERIQKILSTANPDWLSTTLNSWSFIENTSLKQLETLPNLLQDLPAADAQRILQSAREQAFRGALFAEDKKGYLKIATTPTEALLVANGIAYDEYQADPDLRKLIEENPHRDDIYLTIANNSLPENVSDPHLTQALALLKTGSELAKKGGSEVVSTIQSLPKSEQFSTAKATLMANAPFALDGGIEKLIALPIWNDSEREQLRNLGFKQNVNENLYHFSEFEW